MGTVFKVRVFFGVASFCCVCAILIASLLPIDLFPSMPWMARHDKLLHFLAYSVLTFFALGVGGRRVNMIAIFAAVMSLGLGIELLQTSVARSLEAGDLLANLAGCSIAVLFFSQIRQLRFDRIYRA